MKHHQWQIHRQFLATRDAQRRWDLAYQHLVQWASEPTDDHDDQEEFQEDLYAGRTLCSSLAALATPRPSNSN